MNTSTKDGRSPTTVQLLWNSTGLKLILVKADTHRNVKYQELIRDSFRLNLIDFVGNNAKQTELRTLLGKILDIKKTRDKVTSDTTTSSDMRDAILRELEVKIQELSDQYPSNDQIIDNYFSGKHTDALIFLLHKAAEVTRTFNKKKTGSRRSSITLFLILLLLYKILKW